MDILDDVPVYSGRRRSRGTLAPFHSHGVSSPNTLHLMTFLRRSTFLPLFLALLAFELGMPWMRGADLQAVVAVKLSGYQQTTAAGNFTDGESSFDLELRFGSPTAGISAVLNTPGGSRVPTPVDETTLGTSQSFASAAALESSFSSGNYSISLSGTSAGNFPFTFPTTALPPVAITNYAALQDVTNTTVTITWDALPAVPGAESVVLLEIFHANGELVWRSSGLAGDSRSATASGLPGNQSLYGVLTYAHAPLVTIDSVIYAVARATSIRFPIGTRTPPAITTQPLSQALEGQSSVTLFVGLVDNAGASFQWHKDGAPLAGANGSSVNVTSPGFYTVTITNSNGTTTSNAAIVTAQASSTDTRLYAISCRAKVGTGGDILIPGVLVGGTGQRQVLVRAGGPAIQGVDGTLARPQLTLYQVGSSTPIATNTGWSSGSASETAALQAAFTASGLPQYPIGSADCALIATVNAGAAYTATVSGVDNTTGVGLVEMYELGSGSARLAALSCRAHVGAGGDVLIPGIVVAGSGSKSLIIRARGPGIESVANVLAYPKLELFNSTGVKIAENTGWTNAPNVAAIAAATAAAGLAPLAPGSADCAIVVTLPAGGYTAQVSGVDGATGVALVEVYEVP